VGSRARRSWALRVATTQPNINEHYHDRGEKPAIYPPQHFDVNVADMNVSRSYRMTNRAIAAAQTADNILCATKDLFIAKPIADVTLSDIAARSGVTVQTILRRFGDKDSVFAAAVDHFAAEVYQQRGRAVPNNPDDIVANLVQHYEEWGRLMLKMIGEQATTPAVEDTVAAAKRYHRHWCQAMFPDALATPEGPDRSRRLAQLTTICDLRTWELLRIESRLSRKQTATALRELLAPLMTKDS
jgi:AcrR family transcriptional regulator